MPPKPERRAESPGLPLGPSDVQILLAVLHEDPVAWRLVAAWPNLNRRAYDRKARAAVWARLAGVREVDARKLGPKLLGNGICRKGGKIDPLAERMIWTELMRKLPRAVRAAATAAAGPTKGPAAGPRPAGSPPGSGKP
jgi:hypothetical protein